MGNFQAWQPGGSPLRAGQGSSRCKKCSHGLVSHTDPPARKPKKKRRIFVKTCRNTTVHCALIRCHSSCARESSSRRLRRNSGARQQLVEVDFGLVVLDDLRRPQLVLHCHLAREPLQLSHDLRGRHAHAQDRDIGAADVVAHERVRDVPRGRALIT